MKTPLHNALALGILAAAFFAVTFIINRLISNEGGSWIWASSLRFYWMLPFLLIIVWRHRRFLPLWREMRQNPLSWLIWSTIGFGFFYAPLTFAAQFGPSWLIAGTWQTTIIAGIILAPIITPKQHTNKTSATLFFSLIILIGVALMQASHAQSVQPKSLLLGVLPVIIAAFSYPLGNRKMMLLTAGRLTASERILGMTIASLPFWLILSTYELSQKIHPSAVQLGQTLIVAIFSGLIATTLFFKATDQVKNQANQLAAVEATQSGEVLFALLGELIFLQAAFPDNTSLIGIGLVMLGMILHSLKSH